MARRWAGPVGLMLVVPWAAAQDATPARLVTVQAGTVPVIVAAPHGGRSAVPGVPERQGAGVDKFAKARDENTAELADKLIVELEKTLGGQPFAVIARFERKYVDANRAAGSAYESAAAKPYYDQYHAALADACRRVKAKWGRGLLVDLHGQAGRTDAVCRGTGNGKTVTLLRQRFGPAALTGPDSVAGRLERAGYEVFPKGDSAENEDPRYNGGHTVQTYGSHGGYGIDAVQLEFGTKYRRKGVLDRTARDLAAAVGAFARAYLFDPK